MGGVLAYDVCNMDSFKHIPVWLQEARRHIEPHQASFILVGCKADLAVGNNREVTSQQGQVKTRQAMEKTKHFHMILSQDLADYNKIPFLETSAKLGHNVEEAFTVISEEIYGKLERGEYRVEEGWDGIKQGYIRRSEVAGTFNIGGRGQGPRGLMEAEPAHSKCC